MGAVLGRQFSGTPAVARRPPSQDSLLDPALLWHTRVGSAGQLAAQGRPYPTKKPPT
ncbi:hypothetical protein GCM10027073_29570 [Streptomyces chlorus]